MPACERGKCCLSLAVIYAIIAMIPLDRVGIVDLLPWQPLIVGLPLPSFPD